MRRNNSVLTLIDTISMFSLLVCAQHSRLPYKEHRAARIVRQILSAVSYCHEKSIIHRDLVRIQQLVLHHASIAFTFDLSHYWFLLLVLLPAFIRSPYRNSKISCLRTKIRTRLSS